MHLKMIFFQKVSGVEVIKNYCVELLVKIKSKAPFFDYSLSFRACMNKEFHTENKDQP